MNVNLDILLFFGISESGEYHRSWRSKLHSWCPMLDGGQPDMDTEEHNRDHQLREM